MINNIGGNLSLENSDVIILTNLRGGTDCLYSSVNMTAIVFLTTEIRLQFGKSRDLKSRIIFR